MRSRDGNHSFRFSIYKITLLFSSLLLNAGEEYLISYKYSVHDAMLYSETLDISKSMKKCSGTSYNPLILETNNDENLKKILTLHNEEFINYIHTLGLNLEHKERTSELINHSVTILTLKTTCFKVDFNDTFVKISPLK